MAAESNGARNPAFKVTNAASIEKSKKLNNKRSHEATKQNGSVEGEESAGGNNGRNQAFKVITAPTEKGKKLNNKRPHDATKQNGPVEGEEILAAAGTSADAKESPPEKRRKTCDGQDPIELVEVKGDLFSCPATDAMACCVSQDLAMDKGITVRFKEAFRGVDDLRAQAKKVGDVATLYRDRNYVYYLIIKKRYFHKPTYQTLEYSLMAMKNHMLEHKVTHLSMPTIGCGLDGLVWDFVADIIKDVFHGTGIQITIYHYDGK